MTPLPAGDEAPELLDAPGLPARINRKDYPAPCTHLDFSRPPDMHNATYPFIHDYQLWGGMASPPGLNGDIGAKIYCSCCINVRKGSCRELIAVTINPCS
jgi:hypothetical protein